MCSSDLEGGYRATSAGVLRALRAACTDAGALLIADEVQSFARGGATFFSETTGVQPDVVCLAKSAIVGMTILPREIAAELTLGWHSNTFGSGRVFDVNYAYAVIDTFLHARDDLFAGLGFAENELAKGEQLRRGLERIAEHHPAIVSDVQGRGCMWGISVASRPEFVREGWSTKRLVRRLVMSETFRRSGRVSERARERVPQPDARPVAPPWP